MANTMYAMASSGLLLSHFWPHRSAAVVRDADGPRNEALDAAIRSGDYFVTLATTLESIADELAVRDDAAAGALAGLIKELEYAQTNYRIVTKGPASEDRS